MIRPMVHVGIGYDVHSLVAGRPLILGGVAIPHPKGLDGHSDADVLMHAICDAILGALGEGDIGTFFPNTDPRWKGAPSKVFLHEAARQVRFHNGRIINVDATLIAQQPKVMPHIATMKFNIAEALGLDRRKSASRRPPTNTSASLAARKALPPWRWLGWICPIFTATSCQKLKSVGNGRPRKECFAMLRPACRQTLDFPPPPPPLRRLANRGKPAGGRLAGVARFRPPPHQSPSAAARGRRPPGQNHPKNIPEQNVNCEKKNPRPQSAMGVELDQPQFPSSWSPPAPSGKAPSLPTGRSVCPIATPTR